MPPHQFGEGRLGIVPGKFPHQVHVVRVWHLMNYPRQRQKWTNFFELFLSGGKLIAPPWPQNAEPDNVLLC